MDGALIVSVNNTHPWCFESSQISEETRLGNLIRNFMQKLNNFIYLFFFISLLTILLPLKQPSTKMTMPIFWIKWLSIHSELLAAILIMKQLMWTMHNWQEMAWVRRKEKNTVFHLLLERKERGVIVHIEVFQLAHNDEAKDIGIFYASGLPGMPSSCSIGTLINEPYYVYTLLFK